MKKQPKFKKLSPDLEEVPNAELHTLKGGTQQADDQTHLPTGGIPPDDEQLLIYGSSTETLDEQNEEWDLDTLKNGEWDEEEWDIQAFGEGDEGDWGDGEEGGEGDEGGGEEGWEEGGDEPNEEPDEDIEEPNEEPAEEPDEEPSEDPEEEPNEEPGEEPGEGGEDEEPVEEEQTPCDKARAEAAEIKDVFHNPDVQTTLDYALTLQDQWPPGQPPIEVGFSIEKDGSGDIDPSDPVTGTTSNIDVQTDEDTIAYLHTHGGSNRPPSAADVIAFIRRRLEDSPNLETSFIRTHDGTMYAMQITDPSKLEGFYNTNKDNLQGNGWAIGSDVEDEFTNAYAAFKSQGMSDNEAYARAASLVMEQAGLTLFKADPTQPPFLPNDFEKIGAKFNEDGNHYEVDDCPPE